MNQMVVDFNEYRLGGGGGNYYYTMKIENNICTWSSQGIMCASLPPYNVPSYIPKSVKELIMLIGISANGATNYIGNTSTEIKKILTVTLKDELDDIILHHVKEKKEIINKFKSETARLINDEKEIIKKCKL